MVGQRNNARSRRTGKPHGTRKRVSGGGNRIILMYGPNGDSILHEENESRGWLQSYKVMSDSFHEWIQNILADHDRTKQIVEQTTTVAINETQKPVIRKIQQDKAHKICDKPSEADQVDKKPLRTEV